MRRALFALGVAGVLTLAACALTPPPASDYILCNQSGDEINCGDTVNIVIVDEVGNTAPAPQ